MASNTRDLTPLAECTELRDLVLPPNAGEIQFLRQLRNLERISFKSLRIGAGWTAAQTAEEFWAEWEGKKRSEVRDQMSAASAERLRRATEVSGQKSDNSGQPPSSRPPESRDSGEPGTSEEEGDEE